MLHVTPEARTELHGMLIRALAERASLDSPDLSFRLLAENSGLGLALDVPRHGDAVVKEEGRSVLILDGLVSELVEDLTLDIVDTPEGLGLGLRYRL